MTLDAYDVPTPQTVKALDTYIHPDGKVAVLVEMECQSEFVARTDEFRALMHDIAMQIAAANPKFIHRKDVSPELYEKQKSVYIAEEPTTDKQPPEEIVAGKMNRFYEKVCLNEQPFIKDQTITIAQLIATNERKLGEKIAVRRFVRFRVGESLASVVHHQESGSEDRGRWE